VLRGFLGGQIGLAGVKVVGDFVGNYAQGLPSELGLLSPSDIALGHALLAKAASIGAGQRLRYA